MKCVIVGRKMYISWRSSAICCRSGKAPLGRPPIKSSRRAPRVLPRSIDWRWGTPESIPALGTASLGNRSRRRPTPTPKRRQGQKTPDPRPRPTPQPLKGSSTTHANKPRAGVAADDGSQLCTEGLKMESSEREISRRGDFFQGKTPGKAKAR